MYNNSESGTGSPTIILGLWESQVSQVQLFHRQAIISSVRVMFRLLSAVRNSVSQRMSSHSPSAFSVVVARKNDGEPSRCYEPGGYHPVHVGDVYKQRYQVVQQLGWGQYSTVWLVQDLQFVFTFVMSQPCYTSIFL
jgi:hypothetical protein